MKEVDENGNYVSYEESKKSEEWKYYGKPKQRTNLTPKKKKRKK